MATIAGLKSMWKSGGISLEEYHYLFPQLMEHKYELGDFGLYTFQLDLGEHPNLACSNHSLFNLEKSSKEVVQRKQALDLALTLNNLRPNWYARLDDAKEDDWQQKVIFHYYLFENSLGYQGIKHCFDFDWGDFFEDHEEPVDDYDSDFLRKCNRMEIAQLFSEFMAENTSDEKTTMESCTQDLEGYLSPFSSESEGEPQFKMNFHLYNGRDRLNPHMKIFMFNDTFDSMLLLIGGKNSKTS